MPLNEVAGTEAMRFYSVLSTWRTGIWPTWKMRWVTGHLQLGQTRSWAALGCDGMGATRLLIRKHSGHSGKSADHVVLSGIILHSHSTSRSPALSCSWSVPSALLSTEPVLPPPTPASLSCWPVLHFLHASCLCHLTLRQTAPSTTATPNFFQRLV